MRIPKKESIKNYSVRDAARPPSGRDPMEHREIVWMNNCDVWVTRKAFDMAVERYLETGRLPHPKVANKD